MKTIAHVGHTRSAEDTERIFQVLTWLEDWDQAILAEAKPDWIDLSKGRDFLTEDKTYDAVVLHYIFRGGLRPHPMDALPDLRVSPRSSWANWRKRLVQTGAKYIFAFGGMGEVGGSFLVNLDGYQAVKIEEEFWVFKRL